MRRIKQKMPLRNTVAKKGCNIHKGVKARRIYRRRAK